MITVAIVDASKLFRTTLKQFVNEFDDIQVIETFAGGKEFISSIEGSRTLPEIVLLDMGMSELNGLDVTKWIKENNINIKVIILSSLDKNVYILNAFSLGAKAYLLKSIEPEELEKAINEVSNNGYYLNENLSPADLKHLNEKGAFPNKIQEYKPLTPREKEVVSLLCQDFTPKEIADKLNVDRATIDTLVYRAKKRLNVSTTGLIAFGVQMGWDKLTYKK